MKYVFRKSLNDLSVDLIMFVWNIYINSYVDYLQIVLMNLDGFHQSNVMFDGIVSKRQDPGLNYIPVMVLMDCQNL